MSMLENERKAVKNNYRERLTSNFRSKNPQGILLSFDHFHVSASWRSWITLNFFFTHH